LWKEKVEEKAVFTPESRTDATLGGSLAAEAFLQAF
jgi:hypothetical protein